MKSLIALSAGAALFVGLAFAAVPAVSAERAVIIPAVATDVPRTGTSQTAVLAGGCFWGMEAVFEHVKGVRSVTAGYAGGTASSANYEQVSAEATHHAEAIKIVYDPRVVSYGTLLRVYFSVAHDPTTLNAQFPDTGTSYRSAIFPQTPEQRAVATAYIAQLGKTGAFAKPIVTTIETGGFYPAEDYHQHFYEKNPDYPYIVRFDKPKVAAFRAAFPTIAMK
jgi:peptide-methionine (S)-S-oxide reductase